MLKLAEELRFFATVKFATVKFAKVKLALVAKLAKRKVAKMLHALSARFFAVCGYYQRETLLYS
jgi:hypothetical protein